MRTQEHFGSRPPSGTILKGPRSPAGQGVAAAMAAASYAGEHLLNVKYAGQAAEPCDNLYISGLPSPCVDQAQLEAAIAALGLTVIRTKLIPDTKGQGKSAAMVQFATIEDAESALAQLDGIAPSQIGIDANTAPGAVELALAGSGGIMSVKFSGEGSPSDNIYISGLPSPSVDMAALNGLFAASGLTVVRSKAIPDTRGTGSSAAMVQFSSLQEASQALESLNGHSFVECGLAASGAHAPAQPGAGRASAQSWSQSWTQPAPGSAEAALAAWEGIMSVKFAGEGSPSDNIYISGLPSPSIDVVALNDLLAGSGLTVLRSKAIPDTRGSGSSAAMVQFSSVKEASEALQSLNGQSYLDYGLAANGAHAAPQKGAGKAATQSWSQPWAKPAAPLQQPAPAGKVKGIVIPPLQGKVAPTNGAPAKGLPAKSASAKGTFGKGVSAKGDSSKGGMARLLVKYKGADNAPSDNLYIRGLPAQGVTEDVLYELFSAMGCNVVWCKHIADTKGLGSSAAMVQVGSQREAALAMEALNGQLWSDLTTDAIDPSYQAAPTPAAAAGFEPNGLTVKYAGSAASGNLYLSGFPGYSVEQSSLNEMFGSLGCSIIRSKVIPDTKGLGHCAAMVEVRSVEEAAYAIEQLNSRSVGGPPKLVSPRSPSITLPPAKRQRTALEAPQQLAAGEEPMLVKYKGQDNQPSDTVYIRGLPSPQVDASVLAKVIAALGLQQGWSKVIPDSNHIGNSAAMVQVGSPEEAGAAIEALDGQSWRAIAADVTGQRPLRSTPGPGERARSPVAAAPAWGAPAGGAVSWARSGQDAPQAWATPSTPGAILTVKYSGEGAVASDNLYITGLPAPAVDQHQLEALVGSLGLTIQRTKLIPDTRGTGSSAALIQLASQEEAAAAIDMLTGQTCEQLGLEPSSGGGSTASGACVGVGGKSASYAAAPGKGNSWQGQAARGIMQVKYAGQTGEPCDNLYISGLPSPQVDERELHQLFVEMGLVVLRSKAVPDTRGSGSSAAMVQFSSVEEATAVMEEFAGKECPLNAAPFSQTSLAGSGGKGSFSGATAGVMNLKFAGVGNQPSDNLYITGLPSPQVDQATLNNLFEGLELTVVRMKIIPDTKGLGCSAAMVQLGSVEEAHAAVNTLQGQQLAS